MVDCCRPNPPCINFCRLDGHLLKGKGVIINPESGNRYEVLRVLAEGGMSTTYLVYNYAMEKLCVLKEIDSDLSSMAKARELFQREARILKSLSHRGIPLFYDFFASKNYYSLIMEMIYGDSLQMVNPRSEKEAVGWMLQLAKILDYLHNLPKPVIHRDIKPSNLILRHNPEEIVLIDFGAVKEVTQKPGTRIATAGYGSPEQKKGLSYIQSDFYGVGTTLIYLLTRKSPTKFFNPVLNRFVGLEKAGISSPLVEIINFLTQFDYTKRPQSAIALVDLFTQFRK
ncbi:serine/threonine protein kinase [Cyanobacterium sp. HL-69]|uniref:serine/threonine protein kinase n=1 Tax=Cyanobacterium sp. HL-69 TaxID=2054282 RepID=UPI000CA14FA9|nr:serine/threonine protein kinase [Cyanobacterium sp. HL-69]